MAALLDTLLHVAPLLILAGAGSIGLAALVDRVAESGAGREH